jgi:hypothetical protein
LAPNKKPPTPEGAIPDDIFAGALIARILSGKAMDIIRMRQLVDECVALAKAATSNEIRAEHNATAEYYLHLADVEANLAGQLSMYRSATVCAN